MFSLLFLLPKLNQFLYRFFFLSQNRFLLPFTFTHFGNLFGKHALLLLFFAVQKFAALFSRSLSLPIIYYVSNDKLHTSVSFSTSLHFISIPPFCHSFLGRNIARIPKNYNKCTVVYNLCPVFRSRYTVTWKVKFFLFFVISSFHSQIANEENWKHRK